MQAHTKEDSQSQERLINRQFELRIDENSISQRDGTDNVIIRFPFSSETPYLRTPFFDDPWIEILGHDAAEIDLSRLNEGASVLLNHGMSAVGDSGLLSVGKTISAWVKDNRGYVEVKMSRREGMEGLLQDIKDNLVPGVSVGYKILEKTLISQKDGHPPEYRVTKWLPMEITLCDIPADPTVGIGKRSIQEEKTIMTEAVKEKPVDKEIVQEARSETVSIAPDLKEVEKRAADEGAKLERARISGIGSAVRTVGLDEKFANTLIDRGLTLDQAREEIFNELSKRQAKSPTINYGDVVTMSDENETRQQHMTEALLHRADPNRNKMTDGGRRFAGLRLLDFARKAIEARGEKTEGMFPMSIAERAFMATSDFPIILSNVANKSLRSAYEAAPRTFATWARRSTAPDFKAVSRIFMSDAPKLEKVTENGEFKRGIVTEGQETYQLATVGKIIGLTRQAIINDDMSAFTRLPSMFATAAANYESDIVYGILTANAALADGFALFQAANHKNLTSTGTAISIDSLGVGRKQIRLQQTPQGVPMNLSPRYLIVPAALETIAWQFTQPPIFPVQSNTANPFLGELVTVVEARLDAASATAWYLAADPMQIDTIEYCYLEGNEGVYIETRQGFDVDGMEIKARLDFAAKAIDYRGLYKNNGA